MDIAASPLALQSQRAAADPPGMYQFSCQRRFYAWRERGVGWGGPDPNPCSRDAKRSAGAVARSASRRDYTGPYALERIQPEMKAAVVALLFPQVVVPVSFAEGGIRL